MKYFYRVLNLICLASVLVLSSCSSDTKKSIKHDVSITLFESYNAIEIIPLLEEINKKLYSLQKDTSVDVTSGNKLMDQVKNVNMTEELYFKRNPLWKVLNLGISQDANGNSYFDTSAVIGYINCKDTALFVSYIKKSFSISVLPKNYATKFYDSHNIDSILKVHFVKTNVQPITFPLNGVSRIIVKKEGVAGLLGGVSEKIVSRSTVVMFSLLLELDTKLVKNLKYETYTIQFTINGEMYSGSKVKGMDGTFIRLGQINREKVEILKSEFGDKVIEE